MRMHAYPRMGQVTQYNVASICFTRLRSPETKFITTEEPMIHKAQTAQQLVQGAHIASILGVCREVHAECQRQELAFRTLIAKRELRLLELKVELAEADLLTETMDGLARTILQQVAVKEWIKLSKVRYEQVQHELNVLSQELKRVSRQAARSSAAVAKYSRPGARGPTPAHDYGSTLHDPALASQHALEGEAIRKRRFEQAVVSLSQLVGDPSERDDTAIIRQQEQDEKDALRAHDATPARQAPTATIWGPEKRTGGTAPPDNYPGDGDYRP